MDAERSPLAERLFAVPGVTGVFLGSDFVTVTKRDGEWQHLKPAILGAIMEHFMSGAPVLKDEAAGAEDGDEFFDADDIGTVETIKELLETRCARPWRRRRRHHLPRLQGWRSLSQHEGLVRGLPILDRDAEARHPEPFEALPARRAGGSSGLRTASGRWPHSARPWAGPVRTKRTFAITWL